MIYNKPTNVSIQDILKKQQNVFLAKDFTPSGKLKKGVKIVLDK